MRRRYSAGSVGQLFLTPDTGYPVPSTFSNDCLIAAGQSWVYQFFTFRQGSSEFLGFNSLPVAYRTKPGPSPELEVCLGKTSRFRAGLGIDLTQKLGDRTVEAIVIRYRSLGFNCPPFTVTHDAISTFSTTVWTSPGHPGGCGSCLSPGQAHRHA